MNPRHRNLSWILCDLKLFHRETVKLIYENGSLSGCGAVIFENEQIIDCGMQGLCHIVGEFERWVIFSLFQEDDGFPPDPDSFCKVFLCKIQAGAVFFYSRIHLQSPVRSFLTNVTLPVVIHGEEKSTQSHGKDQCHDNIPKVHDKNPGKVENTENTCDRK